MVVSDNECPDQSMHAIGLEHTLHRPSNKREVVRFSDLFSS